MSKMDYVALGRRIREQRKYLHLTQEELAEKAGISLSFMGHIERGSRCASLETLMLLSEALKLTPDALLKDSLDPALTSAESLSAQRYLDMINEISNVIKKIDE